MAISERVEKRRLVVVLGEKEAPAEWRWEAVRFLTNDDGTDAAPPQGVSIPCSADEVSAFIGQACVELQETLTAKVNEIVALKAEIEALNASAKTALDAVTAQRDRALEAAVAVTAADRSWDTHIRPLIAKALE